MDSTAPLTVYQRFCWTAELYPDRPFLNVLSETAAVYDIAAGDIAYGQMRTQAGELAEELTAAGYGKGHRVGLLLENRPSFFVCWFALNAVGASVVPINPDLRAQDLSYLLSHSEQCLCLATEVRIQGTVDATGQDALNVIKPGDPIPPAPTPPIDGSPDQSTECALLYTSGTTGLPKGCVLTNQYFLNCADWYARLGGYCKMHRDGERMLTPLPMFHMNAMACSTLAMIECGGCLSVLDRFHPGTWWQSVAECRATIVHYLGVMPPMLMQAPASPADTKHSVRFGFGAGVDAGLHAPFEERFGFPLIEAWAMTETGLGAVVAASEEPRHVGSRCFGKPEEQIEVRLIDDQGDDVAAGQQGELLVRRTGADPRDGFFDRYLKDAAATQEAWRDGWFHTGDVVRQNSDGTLVFVDRKKNVIRRSGENISAVEVENALTRHPKIAAVAVCATPDPVRGDEVFACIITSAQMAEECQESTAFEIVTWCLGQLAYYKAPGYVSFVSDLPTTATNKIQRAGVRSLVADLVAAGTSIDTRSLKKRTGPS